LQFIKDINNQTEEEMSDNVVRRSKRRRVVASPTIEKTNPVAKILMVLALVVFLAWVGFGIYIAYNGITLMSLANNAGAKGGMLGFIDKLTNQNNPDNFACDGATAIKFDGTGMLNPVPALKDTVQNFCIQKAKWKVFLNNTGVTKSGRKIIGVDWLAETLAYPDHPEMLDAVKKAVQDVHDSDKPDIGWFALPAYSLNATPDPAINAKDVQPPGDTQWDPSPNSDDSAASDTTGVTVRGGTPTATPTNFLPMPTDIPPATPMPTIIVAHIPTLIAVTPDSAISTQQSYAKTLMVVPTDASAAVKTAMVPTMQARMTEAAIKTEMAPTVQALILDSVAQNCVQVVNATDFWSLGSVLQGHNYLEFRPSEYGMTAYSERVGGNGPDAYKAWICVRQVLNWPGNSLYWNLPGGGRATGNWTGAQIMLNPMHGRGDGISNGMECALNGLWLFQCSVFYPVGTATPTPQPIPTSTPKVAAAIPLAQMVSIFAQKGWSLAASCNVSVNTVTLGIGGCENPDSPRFVVDFSEVMPLYQGGTMEFGKCLWLADPKIDYNSSGICLSPFK